MTTAANIPHHASFRRRSTGATGPEKLVGKAKFAMVWVLGQDGQWRVSRVLSYAHEAVP